MLTEQKRTANKEKFQTYLRATGREGVEEFLAYLDTTDFYDAPARTEHGCAYPGGLLMHTLHVYALLKKKFDGKSGVWAHVGKDPSITQDSLALVALLHDICKIGCYTEIYKNKKTYDADAVMQAAQSQVKRDAGGDYIWESVQSYTYEPVMPLGKGEASVILAMKFFKLEDHEIYAIRWSRGFSDAEKGTGNISRAFDACPLALALYEADLEATYVVDVME